MGTNCVPLVADLFCYERDLINLISINLFLILISKLVPLTPELARTLNMFIQLQVMLLRAI